MEKEIYESPVVKMQQVILEQVIAVSTKKKTTGTIYHEWDDDIANDASYTYTM
ncbi:hypothetical protein [Phocaeicola sp.]